MKSDSSLNPSRSFRTFGFLSVIIALLFTLKPDRAFGQAGAVTFGVALNSFASKVGGLIEKAANAGEVVEMGAGAQLANAIALAKNAYRDSLNTTTDNLQGVEKTVFDDLSTEIRYLENHVIDELQKIMSQGSIIVNIIPFSKVFPQMSYVTPAFLAPGVDAELLTVHGNFFDSARRGYEPTLVINKKTVPCTRNSTVELGFQIPRDLYSPTQRASIIDGTITVPYRESSLLGLRHTRKDATFRFQLTGLPKEPGQLMFSMTRSEMKTVHQRKGSPLFKQESSHDDIPDPIGSGKVTIASPTAGWNVEPSTVTLDVEWKDGDWKDFGNRSTTANAAWSIATVHHPVGKSGKVHFRLFWQEYQDQLVDATDQTTNSLEWASTKVFRIPRGGKWTARYEQFNGRKYEIGSSAFANPFVKVETSGDIVTIVTAPFK